MKKIIVLIIFLCSIISAYSQTDSLFLKRYEQIILENDKLKNDLKTEKQNFSVLSDIYKKDTLTMQKQIKDLLKEVSAEKQKVSDLHQNKILKERNNLITKVDSLNNLISNQNQIIAVTNNQITIEKANARTTADKAKQDGKSEALVSIVNSYKNLPFDDLIKSSTKESVAREMYIVGNAPEIRPVLNDLQTYFNVLELLSVKYNALQIKNAETQLSQIKHQSKLLDALKEDVEFYKDFNTALKETISKLVNLDKRKSADGVSEIQKLKFNEIVTILTDYMYNYYDYAKYPYLSDLVLEIIKRKQPNADADVADLLTKL